MSDGPDDERELISRAGRVRRLLRAGSAELRGLDPRATPGLPKNRPPDIDAKTWSRSEVGRLGQLLGARQERLFARAKAGVDRRRLLLVLQAVDCGGKDGTVRSVVGSMDPLGMHLKAFAPPTAEERAHHFLWRISKALPPAGYIGVFNRSHYEDVLAVRVKGLAPKSVWRRRYDEINSFEEALVKDGLTIVKVVLHISYEEQAERLLARLEDPTKRWKFAAVRSGRPRPLGRLPAGVQRRVGQMLGRGPLVRGASRPEVVPQLGRGEPAACVPGRHAPDLSRRGPRLG